MVIRLSGSAIRGRESGWLRWDDRGQCGGNAPPDGYTILFVAPNNAIGASLYKNLPFNFLRDTAPVGGIMRLTNIMIVPPSLPVHSVAEFIDYVKAHPGELSFAS